MPSLQLSKKRNFVWVRLPTNYLLSTGVKAGDRLEASFNEDGALTLKSATFSRKAFALDLTHQQDDISMGGSLIEDLRLGTRY